MSGVFRSFFVCLVVVFSFSGNGCNNCNKESVTNDRNSENYEVIVLTYDGEQNDVVSESETVFKEELFSNEEVGIYNEEFSNEETKPQNLPFGFRLYHSRSGFEIGHPEDWNFESSEDDFFVKFFAKEEVTDEEMPNLEAPVILFYTRVRSKPQEQELNREWFYSNFYGSEDLPQFLPDEEASAIKIVSEAKREIGNLSFYYFYYFAYSPYPIISFFTLSENYLYEISFVSAKILPTFSEDEEFRDFAEKVILTFSILDSGLSRGTLSQKTGALAGEVPYFSQNDPKWKDEQLGYCPGYTIGSGGCAITCAAMVYNYYSSNYTDPSKLNQCLKEKGGYAEGCNIIWGNNCRPFSLPWSFVTTTNALGKKLEKYPVIVWDTCKYQTHFLVAIEKSGNDFLVIDPIDGQSKLFFATNHCFVLGIVYQGEYQGPVFSCEAGPQNPNNLTIMMLGEERVFELDFKNTGTLVWTNEKGSQNYIELWSADKSGMNVDSFLAHPSWISPKIVMSLPDGSVNPNVTQKQVLPGQTARFIFRVKVPNNVPAEKLDTELKIYFIPALAGKSDKDKCWNGAHFLIKVQGECQSGQKEEIECGKCGKKYRECQNGKWSIWSVCQGEGECAKGEPNKVVSCDICSSQTFKCNDQCFWEPITGCVFGGQCNPGTSKTKECGSNVGECKKGIKTIYCTNECIWPSWDSVTCVGEIGPSDEVCDFKDNDCNGKTDDPCFKPVYRFYYSKGGDKDHFLKNDNSAPLEYTIENGGNPVFYTYTKQLSGLNPLFRLYNGSIKDHMYTDSTAEKDAAIAKGYKAEGNIGYCAKSQISGTIPLYRCWSEKYSDHLSTTNKAECDKEGYTYEQITCYVWP